MKIRQFALLLAVFWFVWTSWGDLVAHAIPTKTYEGTTVPDVNQLRFSDFPAVDGSGSFSIDEIARQAGVSPQAIINELGYDPSRSWSPGTKLEQIYKIGDFGDTLGNWTLRSVSRASGNSLINQTLDKFWYLNGESLKDLAQDVPNLSNVRIKDSRVLTDMVVPFLPEPTITYSNFVPDYMLSDQYKAVPFTGNQFYLYQGSKFVGVVSQDVLQNPNKYAGDPSYAKYFIPESLDNYVNKSIDLSYYRSQAVNQILNSPLKDVLSGKFGYRYSNSKLNMEITYDIPVVTPAQSLNLSNYNISDLPGFQNAEFSAFDGWKQGFLGDIQNLSDVPINKFVSGLTSLLGAVGKIDIVFGDKEANRTNTVTGSYQDGFKVPCNQVNCAHLELTDAFDNPLYNLHGKQWISGNSQKVSGGTGFLKFVNGGKEPTGRHPFGDFFKVVLTDVNESIGKAYFGVYFRICMNLWFTRSCTPYFIGPLPWFSQKEKDLIFLGLDGVEAQIPIHYPPLPTPDFDPYRQNLPTATQSVDLSTSSGNDCLFYRGINLWVFREAISKVESGGDWNAVGVYIHDGSRAGRALGRYQFMTYLEEVTNLYRSQGGYQYIKNAQDPNYPKSELAASIPKYFPPEVQNRFWDRWSKHLLDKAFGIGKRGAELLKIAASMHNLGEYSYQQGRYNSGFANDVWNYYQVLLPTAQQKCQVPTPTGEVIAEGDGNCTGEFRNPTNGMPITSGFGFRWGRLHGGIDFGASVGTPIYAADGGVVETAYFQCATNDGYMGNPCGGGYGNHIIIRHCGGWRTLYAHLSLEGSRPKEVTKIQKGQLIANSGDSGSSTGPHLHFETRSSSGRVDPAPYLSGRKYIFK